MCVYFICKKVLYNITQENILYNIINKEVHDELDHRRGQVALGTTQKSLVVGSADFFDFHW